MIEFDSLIEPHAFRVVHGWGFDGKDYGCSMALPHLPAPVRDKLTQWVGPVGLANLLNLLAGQEKEGLKVVGPQRVRCLGEWMHLFRRLHMPYYEQVRDTGLPGQLKVESDPDRAMDPDALKWLFLRQSAGGERGDDGDGEPG
jgi:hypothetical protein